MSRVAVFGAGYVGLVTGACFAKLGHDVVIRDIDEARIAALQAGEIPIFEPGLEEVLAENADRIRFTTDVAEAIEGAEFVYVAVGTPPLYSGDADLSAVWTVVDELPDVDHRIVVVMKSTVPVGTGEKIRHRLDGRGLTQVGYASNPEFTAEGTAVRDFMEPDRVVIGVFDDADADAVAALHAGIDAPVVRCDVASAEMIKLAANAALMTRISFINEIANVCEATGADVVRVAEGIGLDRRIGASFLRAGIGFGGSCLVGSESVLVRSGRRTRLVSLERLYQDTDPGTDLEILTWSESGDGPEFLPIELLTRRWYEGDVVEVRTKMGRRLTCTPDHPFVTRAGRVLAEELTSEDWLPIVQGSHLERVPPEAGACRGTMVLEHTRRRVGADVAQWTEIGRRLAARRDAGVPDQIWREPAEHKAALLAGLGLDGDESCTVGRDRADAMLRLLGELGIVARLRVVRSSTPGADGYRVVVPGTDQFEHRSANAAWVRVVDVVRRPFVGYVYSLEVPPVHTFVTTGGLVVSNCFPKDSLALKQLAANSGYHFQLLNAVIEVNELQKRRVLAKLERHLGSVRGKTIALLGLAFKPNTDDMREAPSLVLAGRLLSEGATVRAWDPIARPHDLRGVEQVDSVEAALADADAAVIVTEWPELADLDWARLAGSMRTRILIDGRNMLDPQQMRAAGLEYEAIGRAAG